MSNQLPTLPDVNFVDVNPQETISAIIGGYEQISGESLADGDPRRLFLLSIAYIIIQQRQQIDAAGKSNLLYYAQDEYLDHLGAFRNTPRLQDQAAVDTQRFTLSQFRPNNIGIPQGTRVTSDNRRFFRTSQPATIIAGQLSVDVPIEAIQPGVDSNDIPAGQINKLVDPIPFVQTTANLLGTTGGRSKEDNESYRFRIYQAPTGFSIAGPEDAYKFWARTANSAIIDVSATSPSAGVVEVRPLLENGEIPSQAILDQVSSILTAKDIRPLTDLVNVYAPDVASFDLDVTYFIRLSDATSAHVIQEKANQAVSDFVEWQKQKLGRDINPDELIFRLKKAGVKRVDLASPIFTEVPSSSVAIAGQINVNYGGLEDE